MATNHSTRAGDARGFTLLELAIVLAVTAILAAMAANREAMSWL